MRRGRGGAGRGVEHRAGKRGSSVIARPPLVAPGRQGCLGWSRVENRETATDARRAIFMMADMLPPGIRSR